MDQAKELEGLLNAWPVDEAMIDYVKGQPDAGIINDVQSYPDISRDLLLCMNQNGSEANVAVGFHAIEFLLWGQDESATGPGARPFTDYVAGKAANAERRGLYLKATSSLLVDSIASLVQSWEAGKDNGRAAFLKLKDDVAMENIITGIAFMAVFELSSERMFNAFVAEDDAQEQEHSCFSDTTHFDQYANAKGVDVQLRLSCEFLLYIPIVRHSSMSLIVEGHAKALIMEQLRHWQIVRFS